MNIHIYNTEWLKSSILFSPCLSSRVFWRYIFIDTHFHRGDAEIRAQKKTSGASRRLSHPRVSSYRF